MTLLVAYSKRKLQCVSDSQASTTRKNLNLNKMSRTTVKLQCVFFAICLLTNVQGKLALDSMVTELCSRSLSNLVYQICTGSVPISDMPTENLSKLRGKRAAMFSRERVKRQIVEECCLRPCSVAQLIAYCPDTW